MREDELDSVLKRGFLNAGFLCIARNYNSNRHLFWFGVLGKKKKPVINQPLKFLIEG